MTKYNFFFFNILFVFHFFFRKLSTLSLAVVGWKFFSCCLLTSVSACRSEKRKPSMITLNMIKWKFYLKNAVNFLDDLVVCFVVRMHKKSTITLLCLLRLLFSADNSCFPFIEDCCKMCSDCCCLQIKIFQFI